MTTITMQLSDDIVMQAKEAGVYDERTLVEKIHQFLQLQTAKSQNRLTQETQGQSSVYDFVMSMPTAQYEKDGMEIQNELRNEWQ